MIFKLLIATTIVLFVLFQVPTASMGNYKSSRNYEIYKKDAEPETKKVLLDLDGDNINEAIIIKSFPGFPGDQNTEVYFNNKLQPDIKRVGYFKTLTTHQIDQDTQIIKLQLLTGQSLNTLFYTYQNKKIERIPVSTEKPDSFYGIVSRNDPEFKDLDEDSIYELLVYHHFLYDKTRTVRVYKFANNSFKLQQEYQESF